MLLPAGLPTSNQSATVRVVRPRLLAAMRAMVGNGTFHEYYNPFTGQAHGTAGFSWTAALYLDAFCHH